VRIAFVAHGYPEREIGGVELVAQEQAEALAARGHQIAVFARTREPTRDDGSTWDEDIHGVLVRRVVSNDPYGSSFRESYDHHRLDEPFSDFLAATRPDIVHVQHLVFLSPHLLAVARAAAIPCVLGLHDFFYLCHRLFLLDAAGRRCSGPDRGVRCESCLAELQAGPDARHRFETMAAAVASADAVIAPSRSLARRFAAEWPILEGRVRIVEPGLAPRSGPAVRRFRRDAVDAPLRLVFIGTWLPHKGLDLLIDAVLALAPGAVALSVYGSGVEGHEVWVDALRERTRSADVRWRGAFAAAELDAILADADVLVLPSRCDESYSRVVREARVAGLAVVAPASGGPADVLRDGVDALLVPPADGAALTAAIARLVADPALVERLASAPTSVPTVADAAARLEALYRELSQAGRPRSGAARGTARRA
jgi:glycosyltransferase involved in cell wall biosynthesis